MNSQERKGSETPEPRGVALSCREAETLISEALDHRLQASMDRVLRKHIFGCPACRRVYQDHVALQHLVQNQVDEPVSPDFMERLEERIAAGEGTPTAALDTPIPLARKLKLFSSGMGTAAALLLSAWLILDEISPPSTPGPSTLNQAAGAQLHSTITGMMGSSAPKRILPGDEDSLTRDSLPIPGESVPGTIEEPLRSVANGSQGFGGSHFQEPWLGRGRPLTPLFSRSSHKKASPGLQPETLGRIPHPKGSQEMESNGFPGEVDLVDPARFAIGLFKGTLQSLMDLKANTKRYQSFPPQKAAEEILRSAEEARDCTHLLLKLDRSLIDLNPGNEAWLKKVHEKLQEITALRSAVREKRTEANEALQKIKRLVKDIRPKQFSHSKISIRLQFGSNLRDSLFGLGMPPHSLQRALKVFSRAARPHEKPQESFFLFDGTDLRIFVIQGTKK